MAKNPDLTDILENLDWSHVMENAAAILIGGAALLGLGLGAFYLGQRIIGIPSYLGLQSRDVDAVAKEMDSRCKILSRVQLPDGSYRGIYLGGDASFPLYYHYTPGKEYHIYPLLWDEGWFTSPDLFGTTGQLVYP